MDLTDYTNWRLGRHVQQGAFQWKHAGRGFLKTPYGLSALSFSVSGIEHYKGETYYIQQDRVGVEDDFIAEPAMVDAGTWGEAKMGEGLSYFHSGPKSSDVTFSPLSWNWGPLRSLRAYGEAPIDITAAPRFMLSSLPIDCGEPGLEKHFYGVSVEHDSEVTIYVGLATQIRPRARFVLVQYEPLDSVTDEACFSHVGRSVKVLLWAVNFSRFTVGPVKIRGKIIDRRYLHSRPTLIEVIR